MIENNKVLAVIPARGGSKGVKRKNIRVTGGKPLIAWAISEAKKSKLIDRLICSSDDQQIIETAQEWGCDVPFVRPKELATDNVQANDVVIHSLEMLPEKYDIVVLLQPTSPLMLAEDIDGSIQKCIEHNASACVSMSITEKHPYLMYDLNDDGSLRQFVADASIKLRQRQDLPKVFMINGAIWVAKSQWFMKVKDFISAETIGYEMPQTRSLDIDTEMDLLISDVLLSKREGS